MTEAIFEENVFELSTLTFRFGPCSIHKHGGGRSYDLLYTEASQQVAIKTL